MGVRCMHGEGVVEWSGVERELGGRVSMGVRGGVEREGIHTIKNKKSIPRRLGSMIS